MTRGTWWPLRNVIVTVVVGSLACPVAFVLHLVSLSPSLVAGRHPGPGNASPVEAGEASYEGRHTSSALSPALGPGRGR
ncbi:MAG: hypothetical protein ACRDRY_12340 [Pseudonocardiaceae bacterium]